MREMPWNKQIAKSRGEGWRQSLIKGRVEARLNPTKVQIARTKLLKPQFEIANALGVSLATYGAIERGKRPITKDRADKLATILNQSGSRLFKKYDGDRVVARF